MMTWAGKKTGNRPGPGSDMNVTDFKDLQSVIECLSFTTADAKYRALVAVSERQGWPLTDSVSGYTATEELSEIESQIFDIEAADVPALFWAYERYENLIGSMDAYFGEFREQERLDHPSFFLGECEKSWDKAVGFMVSVCGLPGPQCLGWVAKIMAAEVRGGLYGEERCSA
jgi:hypothetical protein